MKNVGKTILFILLVMIIAGCGSGGLVEPVQVQLTYMECADADINHDWKIDIMDLISLKSSFNKCKDDDGYSEDADINNSGCVDNDDTCLFQLCYNRDPDYEVVTNSCYNP